LEVGHVFVVHVFLYIFFISRFQFLKYVIIIIIINNGVFQFEHKNRIKLGFAIVPSNELN